LRNTHLPDARGYENLFTRRKKKKWGQRKKTSCPAALVAITATRSQERTFLYRGERYGPYYRNSKKKGKDRFYGHKKKGKEKTLSLLGGEKQTTTYSD